MDKETTEAADEGQHEKQLIEEACTFCLANQDDPNDKSLQSICDYTNTKMSSKQKKDGLVDFLNKGKDQLHQCETTPSCKNSMTKEMKESGKKIVELIEKLNAEMAKGTEKKKEEKPKASDENKPVK